ncbi:sensor histidine kinase [Mariniflexile jejuense]|uniref:histidine kinase n=1 Tax=Mariniflexile jejuense TaxID=1173582 RepID=A0ABW3JLA0_9FLAO
MAKKIKLIKKTSKTFLLTGLVLTILSTGILYYYTKHLLQQEIDEILYSTEARVVNAIKTNNQLFSLPPIVEIRKAEIIQPQVFKDTVIFDPSQKEMELFRELTTFKHINNQIYQVTVRDFVVENDQILIAIVTSTITVFILAFFFLFYFNTAKNLKLWSPFFNNLEQMKRFSLTSNQSIELEDSDILEFSELNKEIRTLTNKVKTDYENLKQFTENVSHEIQTPLAIIQAKIDTFINDGSISDKQFQDISSIQKDIQRLKLLNQKITLITKVDNHQFDNLEIVNLTSLISKKIESFKEISTNSIYFDSEQDIVVSMDAYLADILINNLISNAIKYNSRKEAIIIITNKKSLIISNAGDRELLNPEKLFLRFYTETNNKHSIGLGLTIVKKICDLYNFKVNYSFKEQKHFFQLIFK